MVKDRELIKLLVSPRDLAALEASFKAFYKLSYSPAILKTLFIDKDSYHKFLHSKVKERTPFMPDKKFSDYEFDSTSLPFFVIYTETKFTFPSGRHITLTESLEKPNGLTESVELSDSDGEFMRFKSYLHAEGEVLNRFLGYMDKK